MEKTNYWISGTQWNYSVKFALSNLIWRFGAHYNVYSYQKLGFGKWCPVSNMQKSIADDWVLRERDWGNSNGSYNDALITPSSIFKRQQASSTATICIWHKSTSGSLMKWLEVVRLKQASTIQRHIKMPVKHLRWSFLENIRKTKIFWRFLVV